MNDNDEMTEEKNLIVIWGKSQKTDYKTYFDNYEQNTLMLVHIKDVECIWSIVDIPTNIETLGFILTDETPNIINLLTIENFKDKIFPDLNKTIILYISKDYTEFKFTPNKWSVGYMPSPILKTMVSDAIPPIVEYILNHGKKTALIFGSYNFEYIKFIIMKFLHINKNIGGVSTIYVMNPRDLNLINKVPVKSRILYLSISTNMETMEDYEDVKRFREQVFPATEFDNAAIIVKSGTQHNRGTEIFMGMDNIQNPESNYQITE
jgi:hypothetical protein